MLELLLGQVPEAIYFALFMIFTKEIKTKRLTFIVLMVIEYILLLQTLVFNSWFQILYTLLTFITMKVLYKETTQITDIFTFGIASLVLMLISVMTFMVLREYTITAVIFNRLLMFGFLLVCRKKLPAIQKLYKKLWNRNDKNKTRMKSTTFRSINVVIFNLMFYIINLGMMYALIIKK